MIWIRYGHSQPVPEHGCGFLKRDFMLADVGGGLTRIPQDPGLMSGFLSRHAYTPTGNGFGLDSSVFAWVPLRQRSKRPCSRLISPVYQ